MRRHVSAFWVVEVCQSAPYVIWSRQLRLKALDPAPAIVAIHATSTRARKQAFSGGRVRREVSIRNVHNL